MKKYRKYIILLFFILLVIGISKSTSIYATNELEDGIYTIKSKINEKYVVDVCNGSKENEANIQLYESNETDAQKFNIKYIKDGYYEIKSVKSNKMIDVANGGKKEGTNIWQYESNGTDAQKWIIKKNADNTYSIISKLNNLYIDVKEGVAKNEQNIQLFTKNGTDAQKFILIKNKSNSTTDININPLAQKTIDDGIYTIKSKLNTGYVLDITEASKNNCANLQLYTLNGTNAQKFNVKYLNDGYYEIKSVNSGKLLDVANGGKTAGTNIWQYQSNGTDSQKWIIKKNSDNSYSMISKRNNLYIDVSEGKARNGQNIQVYIGNNTNAQKFIFEKTNSNSENNEANTSIVSQKTVQDGMYTIKSKINNNYVFDVAEGLNENCVNIQLYKANGTNAQKFYVKYINNEYYEIKSVKSGKVLDVANGGKTAGTNIWQYESNGTDAQKWIIKKNSDNTYSIISKLNSLYVDILEGTAANKQNIQLYTGNQTNAQKFIFEKTSTSYNININTSKYPGYKEKLENLKIAHPNWNFELLYTGLNFEDVTSGECKVHSRNLIPSSYSGEWVCPVCGTKLYDSGLYCASEKAVAYYMDPRNFLDENNIFQFEKLNVYESSVHTLQGIKNKVNTTFLENYANDINTACKNKNVNPYYIVARLIQEQGTKGSKIGTGMDGGDGKTYYNPFNIGASGNGYTQIYNNALNKAKSYGWDTMEKALEGGIDFLKKNWLENYQNTLYQNKFDIDTRNGTSLYTHQYMQHIMGAYSEAKTLKSMYSQINCLDGKFTFIIPVYENMSSSISPMPTNNFESTSINVKVNANGGLKLRTDANTSSDTIELIPKGTILLSVQRGINDNWNKVITADGKIGFMSENYLEIVDTVKNCNYTARVKTNDGSGCKVRIGPSTNLDRITTLTDWTTVTVIEKGTYNNINGYDWCRIILDDGRQGYMPLKYLN